MNYFKKPTLPGLQRASKIEDVVSGNPLKNQDSGIEVLGMIERLIEEPAWTHTLLSGGNQNLESTRIR
jgi:hypothetical protein